MVKIESLIIGKCNSFDNYLTIQPFTLPPPFILSIKDFQSHFQQYFIYSTDASLIAGGNWSILTNHRLDTLWKGIMDKIISLINKYIMRAIM